MFSESENHQAQGLSGGTTDSSDPHTPLYMTAAEEAVDELERVSGVHPGYRRAHARGFCCRASFLPSGKAAPFTTAPHLQDREVKAIVRFSGSSTDPALADLLSPAKGMAVQFLLPDGGHSNMVGVTVPVFFARTPESFMEMLTTLNRTKAGQMPKSEALRRFARHFSESRQSLLALNRLKPPASYATNLYYCIHVYMLVDADGRRRPVKFEWIPDSGVQTLSIHDAAAMPDDYLERELELRMLAQPPSFKLSIVFGEEGDPTHDPTKRWPSDRKRIDAGRLVLLEPIAEPQGLVMDPTAITEGIALSDDPILNFRRDTYAESLKRRSGGH